MLPNQHKCFVAAAIQDVSLSDGSSSFDALTGATPVTLTGGFDFGSGDTGGVDALTGGDTYTSTYNPDDGSLNTYDSSGNIVASNSPWVTTANGTTGGDFSSLNTAVSNVIFIATNNLVNPNLPPDQVIAQISNIAQNGGFSAGSPYGLSNGTGVNITDPNLPGATFVVSVGNSGAVDVRAIYNGNQYNASEYTITQPGSTNSYLSVRYQGQPAGFSTPVQGGGAPGYGTKG